MNSLFFVDKDLPYLSWAVDSQIMAVEFEKFFITKYPDLGLKVSQCQIRQIYHKPGNRCDITYRLLGHDHENRPYDQWFSATILASGTKLLQPYNERLEAWPGCGFWKPICIWPEMHMVLYAFPYDPKLPYLGKLLDPSFVKRHVEESLAGLGLSPGWKCQEVTFHPVKYMPGRRCILRYEVLMADTVGRRRWIAFYSKTKPPKSRAKGRYVYEALQQLCANPACTSGLVHIPGPIAYVEDTNTLWQHAWEGTELTQLGVELGWANLFQTNLLPKIAAMLAALHQITLPNLPFPPSDSLTEELRSAYDDAADILQFLPEKQETLTRITDTLSALAPNPLERGPRTIIHGSFKIAQILCRDDQVAVVDFETLAYGDPLADVAKFLASLVYLRVSDGVPAALIAECVERFLASYQAQVPWSCNRQRLAWYVVALLVGDIQSSLKHREATVVANMSLAFEVVQEWLALIKE